jgi:hypothetical protein
MANSERLSTAALVASTAAISCTLTALAAAYVLPKYYQQQEQQHSYSRRMHVRGGTTAAACAEAVRDRASCSTPEPTLPGVEDHQHEQLQQYQQHQQQLQHMQQQQQQLQQAKSSSDMALFSPINPQKRPDPYDVRPRHT